MKPTKTWILIADAAAARIVENTGPGKGLHQLPGKTFAAEQPNGPSDHEGRTFNSVSPMRHKLEPHTEGNPELRAHILDILEELGKSLRERKFDRLIICAPPEMLGAIRNHLPSELAERTVAEIPKDLVKTPTDDLPRYFEDVLAV